MKNNDNRKQILYNKTDFNNHLICQLPNIYKCCKCKKNNYIFEKKENIYQNCIFCGMPNYMLKK